MPEFILRNRPLAFDERQEVTRLEDHCAADPEGAAWTIVVLQSLLQRNGLTVTVLTEEAP